MGVNPEFIVEVGACCQPGLTDVANRVTLAYARALLDARGKSPKVSICGRIRALMPEDYQISIAPLLARKLDYCIGNRSNLGTLGGAVVDSLVSP